MGQALDWTPATRPERRPLRGSYVLLRPVDPEADAEPIFAVSRDPAHWTYLPDGPYESPAHLKRMLEWAENNHDDLYFTLAPLPEARPAVIALYQRKPP